jgi:hypothetical protein
MNELDKKIPLMMGSAMFGPKGRDSLRNGEGWWERRTLGLGWLLYGFVRTATPTTIVEVGTGGSSVCLLQGIVDNGKGHLHTIDCWPHNPPASGNNVRHHPDGTPFSREHEYFLNLMDKHGWNDHYTLYYTPAEEFVKTWNQPIDILVVDGGHLKEETEKELGFLKYLVPGGYALFHDPIACIGEVGLVLEDFIKDNPDFTMMIEPDCLSLAILQRKYTLNSEEFWKCARLAQPDNPNRSDEDKQLTAARDSGVVGEWNGESHFPPMSDFMKVHDKIWEEMKI